jgi:BlaI family transcriptional regulator, penicillinase repressor
MELGPRERQILDILYRLGEASVSQVREQIADPPTYSSVRGMLALLERKGLVRHRQEQLKYVYSPSTARSKAAVSALRHMVKTFFDGSTKKAMAALLELPGSELSTRDIERLRKQIERARKEGR